MVHAILLCISTIARKLKNNNTPLIVAIFLVIGALALSAGFSVNASLIKERVVYGGQSLVQTAKAETYLPAVLRVNELVVPAMSALGQYQGEIPVEDYTNGALKDTGLPIGPVVAPGTSLLERAVSAGDTGTTGILPNFNKEFILPTAGYNWGVLHNYNAVDIADSCGTPVVASADGLVVPDQNILDVLGGWNGGYGNFVLLEHSFGSQVFTRYAHLEKVLVSVGDYVKQGQEIGLMGETGDATGCHLHFEVIGAKNPFAKK